VLLYRPGSQVSLPFAEPTIHCLEVTVALAGYGEWHLSSDRDNRRNDDAACAHKSPKHPGFVAISTPAVDRRVGFQGAIAVACPAVNPSHSCHAVLYSCGCKTRSLAATVSINCTLVSPRAGHKRLGRLYLGAVDIWVIHVAGISLIFWAFGVVFQCSGRPVQGSGLH